MASKRAVQILPHCPSHLPRTGTIFARWAPLVVKPVCANRCASTWATSRFLSRGGGDARAVRDRRRAYGIRELSGSASTPREAASGVKENSGSLRDAPSRYYQFDQILDLVQTKDDSPSSSPSPPAPTLIDVREPAEYTAGTIPTSINIPVSSQPDAMLLSPDDFATRFGFPKPELDDSVIFFCKAGVRSRAAAQLARSAGYTSVGEYSGSYGDWVRRDGPVERPDE